MHRGTALGDDDDGSGSTVELGNACLRMDGAGAHVQQHYLLLVQDPSIDDLLPVGLRGEAEVCSGRFALEIVASSLDDDSLDMVDAVEVGEIRDSVVLAR
eukprot:757492-Hanusia_phi.AAC.2